MNRFGSDTENNLLTAVRHKFFVVLGHYFLTRKFQGKLAEVDEDVFASSRQFCFNEVHLRRTDESRNEHIARQVVKILRCVALLDKSVFHYDNTGSHRHSLRLVVRNVYKRCSESQVKFGYFRSHLGTEFCVKVGKRFVKQEYFGFTNYRTSECDTLSLTARKSLRTSFKQVRDVKDSCGFVNSSFDFLFRELAEFKTERHVLKNGHVRIKSVVLENHRYISVLGRNVVDKSVVYVKLAFADLFKSRDHSQRCRFTATGRSYENDKFFIFDFQVEIGNCANAAGINLTDTFQYNTRHEMYLQ